MSVTSSTLSQFRRDLSGDHLCLFDSYGGLIAFNRVVYRCVADVGFLASITVQHAFSPLTTASRPRRSTTCCCLAAIVKPLRSIDYVVSTCYHRRQYLSSSPLYKRREPTLTSSCAPSAPPCERPARCPRSPRAPVSAPSRVPPTAAPRRVPARRLPVPPWCR